MAYDDVLMWHPKTGGKTTASREGFEAVWKPGGWLELTTASDLGLAPDELSEALSHLTEDDRLWLVRHGWNPPG